MSDKPLNEQGFEPEEPGPLRTAAQTIIDVMRGAKKVREFYVVLYKQRLKFFYPENSTQVEKFGGELFDFIKRIEGGVLTQNYKDALAIRKLDDYDIANAFTVYYWSHPTDKILEPQALEMVARDPGNMSEVVARIDRHIKRGSLIISFDGIDEAKKNLNPITEKNSV